MQSADASASSRRRCSVRAARFLYTIKANNLLTHVKQLQMRDGDVQEMVQTFFHQRCPELEPFLGPILVQLPPSFGFSQVNMKRLSELYEQLTAEEVLLHEVYDASMSQGTPPSASPFPQRRVRIAVEFRSRTWYRQETFDLLRSFRWALVVAHHHDDPTFSTVVDTGAGFLYVRLHGPLGRSVGDYGPLAMKLWAEELLHYVRSGDQAADAAAPPREVFVFLNNSDSHVGGTTSSAVDATCLAEHLRHMLAPSSASFSVERAASARSTQPERSTSRAAPSQPALMVEVEVEKDSGNVESVQTAETASAVADRSEALSDVAEVGEEDDAPTDATPPAKRPRTSTQSGASRDDEVVID